MRAPRFQSAFSLVELSIVLVILGLLTGGILGGQSLIRAAELRSVSNEYARYIAASHTFRDKYFAIPGDFRDATRFWQRQTATGDCVSNSGAGTNSAGACDGNGDGIIEISPAATQSGEMFQYWRQLALAGLIEGTYSGSAGAGSGSHCALGTNCPRSRLNNAGFGIRQINGYFAGNTADWAGNYGIFFDFGSAAADGTPQGNIMKPEEAWNIDTKADDGKPGTGKVLGWNWGSCAQGASATDFAAGYNLAEPGSVCKLHFTNIF
jgi:prepilin-type N-terminal cleavage/methylation domain-containing protein